MPEASIDQLKHAVESEHGGTAKFVQSIPIREMSGEQLRWEGTVNVFDLKGQPDGHFRAYAWSHQVKDGKHRYYAVLHGGPISGPRDAVMAVILGKAKSDK